VRDNQPEEDTMKSGLSNARRVVVLTLSCWAAVLLWPAAALAQPELKVQPVAEKKLKELPAGPLYWRLEKFPTLAQAQTAAGPASLAAEIAGSVWLFTLGPKGGATPGGTEVSEIGPLPAVTAPEYLLRVVHAGGAPGAQSSVHSHPGSEAFYVLAGRLDQKTAHGVNHVSAGQSMVGHSADTPMQVSNNGTTDLEHIAIFVVDATKPFASPAKFQ
jgi:quercetin dioxygenase-like cupin family protein